MRKKPIEQFPGGGKIPPQDIELEKVVLGAILLDRGVMTTVESVLRHDSFYLSAHQDIYGGMLQLAKDRAPIDLISICDVLRKMGRLEAVGGPLALTQLTDRVASSANIEYHARILEQLAIKRRMINLGHEILKKSYDDQSDPLEIIEQVASYVSSSEVNFTKTIPTPASRMAETVKMIENAVNGVVSGYSVGIEEVDNLTGGVHAGEFTVIAARPGMGKTAFALSLATTLARSGLPVYWAQLEMSDVQVGVREVASATGISITDLRKGKISEQELNFVRKQADEIAKLPLYIDTDSYLDVNILRSKAAIAVTQYKAKVLILDYLQLVDIPVQNGMNFTQAMGKISRQCKLISKQYNIPVIALSQLSREVERRPNKRPQLSDLRDSGSIEQDADNVWFLYRPEYYGVDEINTTIGPIPSKGLTEVIVSKIRQGAVGSALVETRLDINRYGRQYYKDDEF